ncbi:MULTISPECIES: hypothetical protein [Myroides]|uniref:Lipoprotein n=2 Tax=Myroides TaxID=76831 RepID=A0AAJ5BEN0_MYRPR|nr:MULTISPECIES: hypothetical protein [Myroides]AJA70246.1 hypothetical protein MYRA21_3145 [Myroides sp. A21]AJH15148.1 hypothetical protein MPR_1973 [Myroides profundi]EHO11396.1 hypothetical protein HMPREF9715_02098 [Myroides odoratimimus CIP 101113]EKB06428.1 hypothetical protein HMPREF9711_00800 [Myroides odoratimimus CCUG 3837]MDM1401219.1 hypothetical protein [Myroides odoratimimus]
MRKVFTLLFAALVFMSCTNAKKSRELGDQQAGEKIIGWYYYNVKQGLYDSIPNLVDDDFFNSDQKAKLVEDLKAKKEKFGKLDSFTMDKWEMTDRDKKAKTKDFYFEYKVKYENEPETITEKIYLSQEGNDLKISKFEFSK